MSAPYTELEHPLEESTLLCRGCLTESGEMKNMVEWGLTDDFLSFTNVQVDSTEGLSQLICSKCEELLEACKSFRNQCSNADKLLRNIAKSKAERSKESQYTIQNEDSECPATETELSCVMYDHQLVILITAPDTDSKIYLPCPYKCRVRYIKKKDLLIHLIKQHDVKKTFTIDLQYYCTYSKCIYNVSSDTNKWFSGRKYLNQHYNNVHKYKNYNCDECDMRFATHSAYKRHQRTCNVKFPCKACDSVYETNERLIVHLMRKHPDLHKQYKEDKKAKRKANAATDTKRARLDSEKVAEYICDSPKRSFATQTLNPEDNIKNDVTLTQWNSNPGKSDSYEAKTDEISTQTVFEDLLSLKSQNSEEESIFFSETVSLSDIQTQTFPIEFGLSRSNKETITSETQSPDLSMKETQTCFCLYDSPKVNFRLFDSVSSSPSSINLTSAQTQTPEVEGRGRSDVVMSETETQTCDGSLSNL